MNRLDRILNPTYSSIVPRERVRERERERQRDRDRERERERERQRETERERDRETDRQTDRGVVLRIFSSMRRGDLASQFLSTAILGEKKTGFVCKCYASD